MTGIPTASRMRTRRALPYVVEFIKFSTGFAVIIAAALLALHGASVAAAAG